MAPYKSEKQRKYMHAKLPKLAAKWDKKYGDSPMGALKKLLGKKKKRG